MSIGISHRVEETLSLEALMKSADHALYRAKALGRDWTERALLWGPARLPDQSPWTPNGFMAPVGAKPRLPP